LDFPTKRRRRDRGRENGTTSSFNSSTNKVKKSYGGRRIVKRRLSKEKKKRKGGGGSGYPYKALAGSVRDTEGGTTQRRQYTRGVRGRQARGADTNFGYGGRVSGRWAPPEKSQHEEGQPRGGEGNCTLGDWESTAGKRLEKGGKTSKEPTSNSTKGQGKKGKTRGGGTSQLRAARKKKGELRQAKKEKGGLLVVRPKERRWSK